MLRLPRDRWLAGMTVMALVTAGALYGPYLGNARVFDDLTFYQTYSLSELARVPLSVASRQLPHFTIAAIDVLTEHDTAVNRGFSVALHLICALMIFSLARRLLHDIAEPASATDPAGAPRPGPAIAAAGASAAFLLHPVAVYGAAYLTQRTILCATAFSIASTLLLHSALRSRRRATLIAAAAAYSLAVFSKEHAIAVGPAAAACLLLWRNRPLDDWRRLAVYVALCTPAALLAVLPRTGDIGQVYESDANEVMVELAIPQLETAAGRWAVSAVVQAGLFFDYLRSWFWPDLRTISADMRVDFAARWATPIGALGVTAYLAAAIAAVAALRVGRGWLRLCGCGLLFAVITYLPEFSRPRFQEPLVMYRSYLWAPGYALIAAGALFALPVRARAAVAALLTVVLVPLAHERLASLATPLALWDDAVEKLARPTIAGAARPYFNRGVYRMTAGDLPGAVSDFEVIIAHFPRDFRGYYGRGQARARAGAIAESRQDLESAIKLRPELGPLHFELGFLLEHTGELAAARRAYADAAARGHRVAGLRIQRLDALRDSPLAR